MKTGGSNQYKKLITKVILVLLSCHSTFLQGQNRANFKSLIPTYNNRPFFVNSTAQDSLGNIWMGSYGGVYIYNGYSYSLIRSANIFPQITDGDGIEHILNDDLKNIWIYTKKGLLCKYSSEHGQFEGVDRTLVGPIEKVRPNGKQVWVASKSGTIYKLQNRRIDSITTIPNINMSDKKVNSLDFDNNDNIYVGTTKGKIYRYSTESGKQIEIIGPFTDYPGGIVLKVDRQNKLWIGTEANGFYVYDVSQQKFLPKEFLAGDVQKLDQSLFLNLFLDSGDNIWGGTDGGGLYKMDSKNGIVKVFRRKYYDEFSIDSNTILDINEDDHKNIWIANKHGTLNIIPDNNNSINYHPGSDNNAPMRVLSILKTRDSTLWMGTDGSGLTKIEKGGKTTQFFNDQNNSFYVQAIVEDNNSTLWLGTYTNGLWQYSPPEDKFNPFVVKNKKKQVATDIRTLYKDSKGRVWVGSNVSLNVYDSNQKLLASFGNNENGLHGFIAESIAEDKKGNIWVGQYNGGLFKFEENESNIENSFFKGFKTKGEQTIPRARSLFPFGDDKIWLINEHDKLLLFNTQSEEFESVEDLGVIKNLSFTAIGSVDKGNFWASTHNSIVHLNLDSLTIKTYYSSDGLPDGGFMNNSSFRDEDGKLYFGNTKGVTYFFPSKLKKKPTNPKLVVHDVQVLNKPAKDLLPNQIKSEVFNLTSLALDYHQSSFSVRFAAIDNILNPYYFYSYRLKGFEEEWKNTYSEGLASYTNVPPGDYTLEIKAHEMNDQSSGFGKTIDISIEQPFWNKPLAHIIYIMLISLLTISFVKWYRLRKKLLINKIIRAKEQDLHNTKMDFFTKMSHEIQTPITLILGPIEDMLKKAELNGNMLLKERLNIISNNAKRLSRIARELTLVRNRDANKLKLLVSRHNLHKDIHDICASFKEIARNKQIDFSVNCPKNMDNTWYDREKLEHILYNLLSNAFKYTPVEGNIQLSVSPVNKKSYVKISVSDSGLGVEKEELDRIFEIFYRSSNKKQFKGAGIGLALTKELVNLHKGKIKVESVPNEGTTFSVKIPVNERFYADEEKIAVNYPSTKIELAQTAKVEQKLQADATKKSILIVEDNYELQQFLKDLFSQEYNILLADNGEEGFYHAKNNIPDLIISDIMMPQMDGIKMSQELKNHNLTKHIPIVLLTAKNSTKAKIDGLKTGAVEYINKPFNTNELILKVNNLLLSKEYIISKYRKELINRPDFSESQSQDELFLENLVNNINQNIQDPDFKVQQLAESLNMSYSSLYRRCLAVTGQNLIDFIREMRLKKGAILLAKFGYSISDAAHLVGFNDPKYFSKSFKNQFGATPKDFKKGLDLSDNIEHYLSKYQIGKMDSA